MTDGAAAPEIPSKRRWAPLAARTRVPVSIAVTVASLGFADPTSFSLAAGIPVATAGLAIRAWAAGHLRKNQALAVSGPYAHVRNPLYIGSLLAGIGFGIGTGRVSLLAAILVTFLLWFLPVIREEEDHIRKILIGFHDYESRVRRFVPSLRRRYPSGAGFDWNLYVVNREYVAALGFAVLVVALGFKMLLGW